jgi:hypothetical protein
MWKTAGVSATGVILRWREYIRYGSKGQGQRLPAGDAQEPRRVGAGGDVRLRQQLWAGGLPTISAELCDARSPDEKAKDER